ncbi:MAG: glucuronate isomerase, partial [Planctomycetes bacterium]|nr:glucuronate isomerase [Planctomycetota bacterium]
MPGGEADGQHGRKDGSRQHQAGTAGAFEEAPHSTPNRDTVRSPYPIKRRTKEPERPSPHGDLRAPSPVWIFQTSIESLHPSPRPPRRMAFLDDDFLLASGVAGDLYHRVAARQPIVDYHCHLSPRDIAEDRRFADLHEAWLAGDHYKWRAMRADGVPEDLITGTAPPHEKFRAWARTVPHTLRNPLFHWSHLELRRHFGIETLLEEATADATWQEANRLLASSDLSARGILRRFDVELVGTTDDPADQLDWHARIATAGLATRVVPTFRPDAAAGVARPDRLQAWARRLADVSGLATDTFAGLLGALARRHADFASAGCRASDHGLEYLTAAHATDAEAADVWRRALAGTPATREEADRFAARIVLHVARLNHAAGWLTQLHLGAFRDPNPALARRLGSDAGADTIGDARQGPGLFHFLATLADEDSLGRTVLYNINPADNALFATLPGSFQDGSAGGLIQ